VIYIKLVTENVTEGKSKCCSYKLNETKKIRKKLEKKNKLKKNKLPVNTQRVCSASVDWSTLVRQAYDSECFLSPTSIASMSHGKK